MKTGESVQIFLQICSPNADNFVNNKKDSKPIRHFKIWPYDSPYKRDNFFIPFTIRFTKDQIYYLIGSVSQLVWSNDQLYLYFRQMLIIFCVSIWCKYYYLIIIFMRIFFLLSQNLWYCLFTCFYPNVIIIYISNTHMCWWRALGNS